MDYKKEEITNSVLALIIEADKYINSREISGRINVSEEGVIKIIERIINYNEQFLDVQGKILNDGLVYVRVREWIREDVRKFLSRGGFISIQKELDERQKLEREHEETRQLFAEVADSQKKTIKQKRRIEIAKAAGLIMALTIVLKKLKNLTGRLKVLPLI